MFSRGIGGCGLAAPVPRIVSARCAASATRRGRCRRTLAAWGRPGAGMPGMPIGRAIVGVAVAALAASASAQPDRALEWRAFRSFTSADGLPQNSVLALLQDADGYVYAGTNHGLARYDGRSWQAVE